MVVAGTGWILGFIIRRPQTSLAAVRPTLKATTGAVSGGKLLSRKHTVAPRHTHCTSSVQVAGPTPMTVDIPSSERARLREDFVPSCIEEVQQWVWDRQQDLQAATMAGRPEEVGRISGTEFKQNKLRSGLLLACCLLRWVSWFDDWMAVRISRRCPISAARQGELSVEGRIVRAQESSCWGGIAPGTSFVASVAQWTESGCP